MNITRGERWAVVLILLVTLAALWSLSMDGGEEPPPSVVRVFEDGSFVMSDGTVGCLPDGSCNN